MAPPVPKGSPTRSGSPPAPPPSTRSAAPRRCCARAAPGAPPWQATKLRDNQTTMEHDDVMSLVREHLAEELEVDPGRIEEGTRFREDLEADSLDLYELVMELEDRYGIKVTEEEATRISTVGDAVAFVLERAPA